MLTNHGTGIGTVALPVTMDEGQKAVHQTWYHH